MKCPSSAGCGSPRYLQWASGGVQHLPCCCAMAPHAPAELRLTGAAGQFQPAVLQLRRRRRAGRRETFAPVPRATQRMGRPSGTHCAPASFLSGRVFPRGFRLPGGRGWLWQCLPWGGQAAGRTLSAASAPATRGQLPQPSLLGCAEDTRIIDGNFPSGPQTPGDGEGRAVTSLQGDWRVTRTVEFGGGWGWWWFCFSLNSSRK